ncbi:hypothetical protein Pint_25712 [Pistacia integerrima]|uniref:Uncharacterized protein n=1 Tax=Pistacia integerrima TaxID=434235 RepID=A0ACC0YH71_9ROSI|nr:hypothetical protein Pint_25712 [Pistacia integerrima]
MHGESYQDFMLSKLVPVPGNIGESNLGMNPDLVNKIATDVDVIINSAANTTFDERFDVAVDINTKGPSQMLNLAKQCKKLSYVTMGNLGETLTSKTTPLSQPPVDVDAEVKLALDSSLAFHRGAEVTQKMKEMGLERAKSCGWKNVYEFTKAMGELVIDKNRGEIPVAIVRPSIVESTFREPFPGWIQGNRMIDPVAIAYGKGHLPAFLNPTTVIDIIPVDMVVNAIISAVAKHGIARKPGLNVYHVSSSGGKTVDIKRVKIFSSVEDVLPCISKAVMERYGVASGPDGLARKFCEKIIDQSTNMVKTYEPYYTSRWFDSTETYKLWEAMSEDEKLNFGFDVKSLDWRNYFINIHVPGLRKYVIKNGR